MWPISYNPFPSFLNPLQSWLPEWEELLSPVSLCRLIFEHLRTMLLSARHGSKLLMKCLCQTSHLNPLPLLLPTVLTASCEEGAGKGLSTRGVLIAPSVCVYGSPEQWDLCPLTLKGYIHKPVVWFGLNLPWFQFVEWGFEEVGSLQALNIVTACPRAAFSLAPQACSVSVSRPQVRWGKDPSVASTSRLNLMWSQLSKGSSLTGERLSHHLIYDESISWLRSHGKQAGGCSWGAPLPRAQWVQVCRGALRVPPWAVSPWGQ